MKLLDIGAFNGDTALHFISYPDIDSIDAYEPNTTYMALWEAIHSFYPQIKFIPDAVYTYTGEIEYSQRPDNLPLGSSVMRDKSDWGNGEIKKVRCIDILDILPKDPFCMKVDVEGAEYDILERIIANNKSHLIDRLYVEWHDNKMSSDNSNRQKNIVAHFGKRIKSWL